MRIICKIAAMPFAAFPRKTLNPKVIVVIDRQLTQPCPTLYQALRKAMLQFNALGAGKAFFDKSGYGDMVEIGDEQMQRLRPYLTILQQRVNR